MKARLFRNLNQDRAAKSLPKPYLHFIPNIRALGFNEFNVACFPHAENGTVVLSSYVKKLINSKEFLPKTIVIAQNFTIESSKLLEEKGIIHFSLREYFWTDASYIEIRRPK